MYSSYQAAVEIGAEERERLILEHLPQVRLIARRIHERLPESVHLEDLVSAGVIGLIAAVDHFDPVGPARPGQFLPDRRRAIPASR